jgi:hypothetical protein
MIIPKKLPRDSNQRAFEIVRISTGEDDPPAPEPERSSISVYLAQIGSVGGKKGGKVRAKNLSAKRREQIARKAARSRWKKT